MSEVDGMDFDIPNTRPDIMGEFFNPWRRKIGAVTLVMACIFMAGWVRSWSRNECVQFPVGKLSRFDIGSTDRVLGIAYHTFGDPSESQFDFFSNPEVGAIGDTLSVSVEVPLRSFVYNTEWTICGGDFAIARTEFSPDFNQQDTFAIVPYWFIVISLTALSAALLLSKPGSSTVKKSSDPSSEKVNVASFSNGWRKKVGIVTLLTSCLFAGLWVRSYWYNDDLMEVTRRHNEHDQLDLLTSLPGEIVWAEARNLNASHSFTDYFLGGPLGTTHGQPEPQQPQQPQPKPLPYSNSYCGIPINRQWHFVGLRYGDGTDEEGDNACRIIVIPYWFFTIPLTLITLSLLVSKPPKSTQANIGKPVPEKGA